MQQLLYLPVSPRVSKTYKALGIVWLVLTFVLLISSDLIFWFVTEKSMSDYYMDYDFLNLLNITGTVSSFILTLVVAVLLTVIETRLVKEFNRQGEKFLGILFFVMILLVWAAALIDFCYLLGNLNFWNYSVYDTLALISQVFIVINIIVLAITASTMAIGCAGRIRTAGFLLLVSLLFYVICWVFSITVIPQLDLQTQCAIRYNIPTIFQLIRYLFMGIALLIIVKKHKEQITY